MHEGPVIRLIRKTIRGRMMAIKAQIPGYGGIFASSTDSHEAVNQAISEFWNSPQALVLEGTPFTGALRRTHVNRRTESD